MQSIVCFGTRSGNTRRIAEAIAEGLRASGPVTLASVEEAIGASPPEGELLVIGGPTEGHGMTPAVRAFLDSLPATLDRKAVAAFDTRVDWPRWLSGSAAAGIAKVLQARGAHLVAPPESFIVSTEPALHPGEVDRARAWGASLADRLVKVPSIPAGATS